MERIIDKSHHERMHEISLQQFQHLHHAGRQKVEGLGVVLTGDVEHSVEFKIFRLKLVAAVSASVEQTARLLVRESEGF